MVWAIIAVLIFLAVAILGVGFLILRKQEMLDLPVSGELFVDMQGGEEKPGGVYFFRQPGGFKDNEVIKLQVKVVPAFRKENRDENEISRKEI